MYRILSVSGSGGRKPETQAKVSECIAAISGSDDRLKWGRWRGNWTVPFRMRKINYHGINPCAAVTDDGGLIVSPGKD